MLEYMAQNQMYIVLCIVLLIWAGIVGYMLRLDGKVKRLERQLSTKD